MNSLPGTAVDESADYRSWELPGSPIQVRISAEAIQCIRTEAIRGMGSLPQRGAEVGGVLLGTAANGDPASVTIDDILPLPIEYASGPTYTHSEKDRANLRETLRAWDRSRGRPIYIVGFYRTQIREGLWLAPEDLQVFADFFPDPSSVALLIRPRAVGPCEAGLFFRNGAGGAAEPKCLELPPLRDPTPKERPPGPPSTPPDLDAIPLPPLPGGQAPKTGFLKPLPLWVSWWIQVPILAGLLLADGYTGCVAAGYLRPQAAKAKAPPANPYALSLLVMQYRDNLHLTWDHNAPALASAEGGTLSIVDGGRRRSLDLSLEQLRNGSVTYRHVSRQVTLRLEVFLKDNRTVSETWKLDRTSLPRTLREPPLRP